MKLKIKPGQERMGFQAFLHVLYRFNPFLVPVWDKLLLRIIIGLCRSFLTVAMIMMTAKIIDDGLLAKNPAKSMLVACGTGITDLLQNKLFLVT